MACVVGASGRAGLPPGLALGSAWKLAWGCLSGADPWACVRPQAPSCLHIAYVGLLGRGLGGEGFVMEMNAMCKCAAVVPRLCVHYTTHYRAWYISPRCLWR